MYLEDNELGMLEQLTYITDEVGEEAGIEGFEKVSANHKNQTVGEILADFDEKKLKELEKKGDEKINNISGKEWAGIIRYLKKSRLKDLVLRDVMEDDDNNSLALCFTEKGNTNEAIVAFNGTTGDDEWVDNVEGLNKSDTQCQKDALNYIENLPYDNITVTGHSKGGNKAMYVTITSDKVKRCVAYDGQGFSQEFYDKYWAEVQEKGGCITSYSLSTDYVHILLFPVPNAKPVYCQGYGKIDIQHHHCPNSFFVTDEKGNIKVDKNGIPEITEVPEDPSLTMVHEFVTFALNNASDEEKQQILEFLATLLPMVMKNPMDKDEVMNYLLSNSNQDTLALILAYLMKYMEVKDLSSEDLDKLLKTLGLGVLDDVFTIEKFGIKFYGLADFIDYARKHLNDDDDDWFTKLILPILLENFTDIDYDIKTFWEKVDRNVKRIDGSKETNNKKIRSGEIRDFSSNVYDALMDSINRIENLGVRTVSSWNNYADEDWFYSLFVNIAIKGINAYFNKVSETNTTCKKRVESVFGNVRTIDDIVSCRLDSRCQALQNAKERIVSIKDNIELL